MSDIRKSNSIDPLILRECKVEEIRPLRHEILRPTLPFESTHFPGDDLPTTRHFAAVCDARVVGCVSIIHSTWNNEPAWQLRGMAVATSFQQHGVGSKLLAIVHGFVQSDSFSKLMWCNARKVALKFYEKNGWTIESDEFEVPTAGPHRRMKRIIELSARPARE